MDSVRGEQIVRSAMTVSDKIRGLHAAGYPRAEIARALGKRYQHVRNVLEADKARAESAPQGVSETAPSFGGQAAAEVEDRGGGAYRLVIRPDGSVMIPEAVRAALGVRPGQPLIARLEGEDFKLFSTATGLRRAQELLRPYFVEGVSWADELIAERRREVAREDSGG